MKGQGSQVLQKITSNVIIFRDFISPYFGLQASLLEMKIFSGIEFKWNSFFGLRVFFV